jgi:phenylalanyl-tRNA synthetase beta chain
MPKIEVNESLFFSLAGRAYGPTELEDILPGAKAELDEWELPPGAVPGGPGSGERIIKIELNDTNRPDLWSTAGLARQLRVRETGARTAYPFFSREGALKPAKRRVIVESSVRASRPYLAGFIVSGRAITDSVLKDMIQTQEKLTWNFGRKRRTISMGLYRTAIIQWPVHYKAVAPDSVRFVPLQGDRPMTLSEILKEHPKGREYGFINEHHALHPLLVDAKGSVLSYPPIINSADLGAVQVGDTDLFIELTGTDMASVTLSASMVACDLADMGYIVEPIAVEYPYDTPFGRDLVFPYYFQLPVSVDAQAASRLLGLPLSVHAVREAVERMGSETDVHGQYVTVFPPEYRNDFLHPVDVVEDVMMGKGMAAFAPERPRDFTVGRRSAGGSSQGSPRRPGIPGDDLRLPGFGQGSRRADAVRRIAHRAHRESHVGELRISAGLDPALSPVFRVGVEQGRISAPHLRGGESRLQGRDAQLRRRNPAAARFPRRPRRR